MVKFGVRWKTVRWRACRAMTGMAWIPVDPVPMMPTRLPVKSTPSCGHRPVWYRSPVNVSSPGKCGTFGVDRQPTAETKNRAVTWSPSPVRTSQRSADSSKTADVTRVPNRMLRRSENRSATWFRYRSTSGCSGYRLLHSHSCSSSGENE